ncbi:UNVERIFIED_CONTAM: hypothetical protein GTU68_066212 [Idotea baltica]|nr:hypothetical protein [Idotea baltica]
MLSTPIMISLKIAILDIGSKSTPNTKHTLKFM